MSPAARAVLALACAYLAARLAGSRWAGQWAMRDTLASAGVSFAGCATLLLIMYAGGAA